MSNLEFFTVEELARKLKVSEKTVWRMKKSGEIAHTMIRGFVRFTSDELQAYIEKQTRRVKTL